MIIARLQGGLGNQLFEYALGRALALKNSTDLALDLSQYAKDKQRHYMLDGFSINARIATTTEIGRLIGDNRFTKKLRALLGLSHLVHEPHFAFYPKALEAKDPSYLDGYWQSEKYFTAIAPTLRKEIVLDKPLSEGAAGIATEIREGTSVSIHIRRGDYHQSQFAVCSIDYYTRAIEFIRTKVADPHFFIFSDDTMWTQENLTVPDATFVSGHGISDAEELVLMSYCKHNIVANSSFSWWGAWLNQNKEKIVVAPKKWFILDVHDTKDLLPVEWSTI